MSPHPHIPADSHTTHGALSESSATTHTLKWKRSKEEGSMASLVPQGRPADAMPDDVNDEANDLSCSRCGSGLGTATGVCVECGHDELGYYDGEPCPCDACRSDRVASAAGRPGQPVFVVAPRQAGKRAAICQAIGHATRRPPAGLAEFSTDCRRCGARVTYRGRP